jgi:hypothetical protein
MPKGLCLAHEVGSFFCIVRRRCDEDVAFDAVVASNTVIRQLRQRISDDLAREVMMRGKPYQLVRFLHRLYELVFIEQFLGLTIPAFVRPEDFVTFARSCHDVGGCVDGCRGYCCCWY